MKLIVASPHKVGSTWLVGLLCEILGQKRPRQAPVECRANPAIPGLLDLSAAPARDFLANLSDTGVFKSHSRCPEWIAGQNLADKTYFFTILRDPRDALVSFSFYVTSIPPDKGGHPELDTFSTRDRLAWILESGRSLSLFESWANAKSIHKFSYEELLADPKSALTAGFEKYGLRLDVTDQAIAAHSFESKSGGRTVGTEDAGSFLRKGSSGDWKNHFDTELVEKFKAVHKGRWNRILLGLGYEKDPDWRLKSI